MRLSIFLIGITLAFSSCDSGGLEIDTTQNIAIAIHGGAGTITRVNMTREVEEEYRSKLLESLKKGYDVLESGGSSLDAVTAAIKIMDIK